MAAPKVKTVSRKSQTGGKAASKPPAPSTSEKVVTRFLKLTGFKRDDILSSNYESWIFVTTNGGKYQLNRPGAKLVRVLMGPNPPKTTALLKE